MLQIGDHVEGYEVEGFLGAGGMGRVYLLRHGTTGERHALKLLSTPGPGATARLQREGQLQARLEHPNVVRSFATLRHEDQLGLLLEYVEGPTLADLLEGGEVLPLPQLEALFRGIADGVAAAHRLGIVHRDLKPQNVLLSPTPDGFVPKVTDFGIAKAVEGDGLGTRTGAVLGTPLYMAPEQFRDAKRVDARADVYALGAIAAQMLTGRCHQHGVADMQQALDRAMSGPPRQLYASRPGLPDRILAAVTAAMAPRPEQRPATALELRHIWDGTLEWQPVEDPLQTLDPDAPVAPCVLPSERDSFVGRRADLLALADRAGPGRLVTVVGPAGVGKTRLALRFAWSTQREWSGGVWFVDASPATDATGLVHALADALGIKLFGQDSVDQVGHALGSHGRCLVVLDNTEQLGRHAAESVGRWLDIARDACLVLTSRTVIGLRGEQVLELEPLPPDEAAALFSHRALAAHRRFDPAPHEAAISQLVEMLDGLPLAIELIASRARLMSPARMLERLSDGSQLFRVLGRSGAGSDRHATLRVALDWSWSLLQPHEQAVFAQLSVFRGGFSLDAVEAVVDTTGSEDAPWTLDVLQALLDQSLVRTVGPDRFDLLFVVRAYGEDRLGAEERARAERRHGDHFSRLAADAMARFEGRREVGHPDPRADVRAQLATELHNLVAASERATARGDGEIAAATALGAWVVLDLRGAYAWAATLVERAADHASGPRARLVSYLGLALERMGQMEQAMERQQEALQLARELGDALLEGRALTNIAIIHAKQGQMELAQRPYREALRIARELGNRRLEAIALTCIGNLHLEQDRIQQALEHYEEALGIVREIGDRQLEGNALGNLAIVHDTRGRRERSLELYGEALEIAREVGEHRQECYLSGNLGNLYLDEGRDEEALEHFERAQRIAGEIGDRRYEGIVLDNLGGLFRARGEPERAQELYEAALHIAREVGNRQHEGMVHGNLGEVCSERGQHDRALEHFEQALALVRGIGHRRTEGTVLGAMGLLHAEAGRFEEARAAFEAGVAVLRRIDAPSELGTVLARRAIAEGMAGDLEAAGAALAEAEQLARQLGAGDGAALGQQLARAREALQRGVG